MTKQNQDLIRQIASKLPVVMVHSSELHLMSGAEMLELFQEGEIEGINKKEVKPDLQYQVRMPVMLAANHYRRMKKAFQKQGSAGVSAYIAWVNQVVADHRERKN